MLLTLLLPVSVAMNYLHYSQERQERKEKRIKLKMRSLPHSLLIGFITLALATPAQILLGRPFYYRFFQAVKHRKRFTTDTLVVLSTSVAYLYSLFTLLFTNSHVLFFEASSSVLTIFTIGEYLERRVLNTTTESLKNLIALKPKTATVMRNGREEVVDSDEIAVDDIVIAKQIGRAHV